jgi:hypothetical protein
MTVDMSGVRIRLQKLHFVSEKAYRPSLSKLHHYSCTWNSETGTMKITKITEYIHFKFLQLVKWIKGENRTFGLIQTARI